MNASTIMNDIGGYLLKVDTKEQVFFQTEYILPRRYMLGYQPRKKETTRLYKYGEEINHLYFFKREATPMNIVPRGCVYSGEVWYVKEFGNTDLKIIFDNRKNKKMINFQNNQPNGNKKSELNLKKSNAKERKEDSIMLNIENKNLDIYDENDNLIGVAKNISLDKQNMILTLGGYSNYELNIYKEGLNALLENKIYECHASLGKVTEDEIKNTISSDIAKELKGNWLIKLAILNDIKEMI